MAEVVRNLTVSIDCPPTRDQAMPMFAKPVGDWHRWFAWKPVRAWDGRWRWLCLVERRLCQNHSWLYHTGMDQWFQHRVRP